MRVVVELTPPSPAAALLLAEWGAAWGTTPAGEGVELETARTLAALLDLKTRGYGRGVTLNVIFAENFSLAQ